jgi:LEA14-like dessication related protein
MTRVLSRVAAICVAMVLGACAAWTGADPPRVTVAGIEAEGADGMELHVLVKLRVVNPNDFPIEYDGLAVKLEVQGRTIASGASNERGAVPRYGESIIALPVNISLVDVVRNAVRIFTGEATAPLHYRLEGKLNSPLYGMTRFQSEGDLRLPAAF